ncbi:DUF1674 domain-containing protein [Camelimonas sp. ID_303_24]
MSDNSTTASPVASGQESGDQQRALTPAAQRALAEAEARRADMAARIAALGDKTELGGRAGPDPVRYQDWENNGIASDF